MKHVIVHIGPHKTGSTAIQKCLGQNADFLALQGILYLHGELTHGAAITLAKENFEEAEQKLEAISTEISEASEQTIILSQEDFAGDLIGRSSRRQIYPKLTKNLRVIKRALRQHRVTFLFFVRDEAEWMRSCYGQYLKYRTKFSDFEAFANHFGGSFQWPEKLQKPVETIGDELVQVPYTKTPTGGIDVILELAGLESASVLPFQPQSSVNPAPGADRIKLLEHVNRVSAFQPTAWFAKSLLTSGWQPSKPTVNEADFPEWPPAIKCPDPCALPSLLDRTRNRVSRQDVNDVMPELSIDLKDYVFTYLPADMELPTVSRDQMEDQSRILDYHLRGKSKLAHLNALVISYLRRDTVHTEKARLLFHRIWNEKGMFLVNELSTRWLISTFQTFLDHGRNEAQRQIGATGYFYANMMKIYEGERSIEGRLQDEVYAQGSPQTKNEFRGLDRFSLGGTDLMLNTNALALEIAAKDDVAGLVLQEFLLRVKESKTVFSRMDTSRTKLGAHVEGFLDTWSFFEEPRGD